MNAPARRRRPAQRPADILAAALDLFAERGFAGTRMEDVAARAGLSKAAVYLYFPDKGALLRAVVAATAEANLGVVRNAAQAAPDGPVAPVLRQVLLAVAQLVRTTRFPDLAKLVIAESRAHPEFGQVWMDHVIGSAFPLLRGLIARGIAQGEFRAVDPAMTARSVIAPMLLGALWRSVFEPLGAEPLDVEALAAHHADLMLHGLEKRP